MPERHKIVAQKTNTVAVPVPMYRIVSVPTTILDADGRKVRSLSSTLILKNMGLVLRLKYNAQLIRPNS